MATYSDMLTLSKDAAFLGKLAVAVTKYTDFVLNNATVNIRRLEWGNRMAAGGADAYAQSISLMIAFDGTIQTTIASGGASSATDAQIQTAVETWVNRTFAF